MRKAIKKLRDLVAELKAVSADALAESDRLIKKIDREAARKSARTAQKKRPAKAR